jgi:pimeloyl-ACP methyl ester carboxylesterase
VLGTTDPGGTVDVWERVVGILPRGELHLVEGAGHLSWFDNPGQVGGRVQQFLSA